MYKLTCNPAIPLIHWSWTTLWSQNFKFCEVHNFSDSPNTISFLVSVMIWYVDMKIYFLKSHTKNINDEVQFVFNVISPASCHIELWLTFSSSEHEFALYVLHTGTLHYAHLYLHLRSSIIFLSKRVATEEFLYCYSSAAE